MTRSLVTGGAGFIGQRLVETLLAAGDQVVCLDHFSTHRPNMFDSQQVEVVRGDVRDRQSAEQAVASVDRVFHLAAAVATKSLEQSRSVNVEGTRNLATAAAACSNPPVFLYVSSLAAAGPSELPATESGPCAPVSHYGRTKLEAETLLQGIAERLPITIVRPPCVFGPGDRNLLALYQTVKRGWNVVLSKKFCYSYLSVTDLVSGMVVSAAEGERLAEGENPTRQGLYYLTDPEAVTFPQLAEKIAATMNRTQVRHVQIPRVLGWATGGVGEAVLRLTGRRVFLNLDKIREGVSGSWHCDGTRAKEQLNFAPAADLMTRLQETKDYYDKVGWL